MSRPNVFDDSLPAEIVGGTKQPEGSDANVASSAAKPGTEMFRTSLYISRAVHDVLREIAFHERKKVQELVMEGLDHVLQKRRHPSSAEIVTRAKTQ